ncbi:unnamed protein product [marine sediment metagenome]|uniref:Uncharacterized protein n=1 Tax=marine sediment metagenome TaxID=412755 RepID=X1MT22_9ZZZZ
MGKTKGADTQALPANPNTPTAEHAPVGVVDKLRAAGIHREFPQNLPETPRLKLNLQVSGYLLQLTGAAGRTMSTVNHIARQKQLQGGARQP